MSDMSLCLCPRYKGIKHKTRSDYKTLHETLPDYVKTLPDYMTFVFMIQIKVKIILLHV